MKEWPANHPQTPATQEHAFHIEGKRIVPQALIVNQQDSIDACLDGQHVIGISMIRNLRPGTRRCGFVYKFWQSEPVPLPVSGPSGMDLEQAYVMIVDHQLATLTNADGIAKFDELPVGCDVPIRIFSGRIKQGVKTKPVCSTLETPSKHLTTFFADKPGHYRHVIQIVQDE